MTVSIDKTWTGALSSIWELAGNWSPAVIPAAGEDVMIPAGTPSIDCTGQVTKALGVLIIAQGYTGTIGASGARLTGSCTQLHHKGSGKLWFVDNGATPRVWIQAGTNGDVADIDGGVVQLEVMRGTVTVAASATAMTRLLVGYVNNKASDSTVTINGGAGTLTTLYQIGGVVNASNIVTNSIISGGIFVKKSSTAATLLHVSDARVYYEGTGASTIFARHGAVIDYNRTYAEGRGRQAAVTITALYRYPGCQVLYDPTIVTVSADYDSREPST